MPLTKSIQLAVLSAVVVAIEAKTSLVTAFAVLAEHEVAKRRVLWFAIGKHISEGKNIVGLLHADFDDDVIAILAVAEAAGNLEAGVKAAKEYLAVALPTFR